MKIKKAPGHCPGANSPRGELEDVPHTLLGQAGEASDVLTRPVVAVVHQEHLPLDLLRQRPELLERGVHAAIEELAVVEHHLGAIGVLVDELAVEPRVHRDEDAIVEVEAHARERGLPVGRRVGHVLGAEDLDLQIADLHFVHLARLLLLPDGADGGEEVGEAERPLLGDVFLVPLHAAAQAPVPQDLLVGLGDDHPELGLLQEGLADEAVHQAGAL